MCLCYCEKSALILIINYATLPLSIQKMMEKTYFPTTPYLFPMCIYTHSPSFLHINSLLLLLIVVAAVVGWYVSRAPAGVCVSPCDTYCLTVSSHRRIEVLRAPSKIQRVMPFVHTKVDPKYRKNHYPHPDYSLLNIDTIVCLGMIATLVFTFWYTQF